MYEIKFYINENEASITEGDVREHLSYLATLKSLVYG